MKNKGNQKCRQKMLKEFYEKKLWTTKQITFTTKLKKAIIQANKTYNK